VPRERLSTAFPADGPEFSFNNFDFLRCAMAIVVILSHSWFVLSGVEEAGPWGGLSRFHMDAGDAALNVFFLISGFLVAHSWYHSRGLLDFVRRRALRIYPAFVAAMLVCAFVVAPVASDGTASTVSPRQLVRVAVQTVSLQQYGAPGMFTGQPAPGRVNASMWSIQYEWWCYMGLALAGALGLLRRVRLLTALWALLILLNWFEEHYRFMPELGRLDRFIGDPGAWTRLAPLFLSGVLFHHWRTRIPHSGRLAIAALAALAVSFVQPHLINLTVPIAGAYLVFYVAYERRLPLQRFGRFGDFSYGLYLYAFPIQQLLVLWLRPALTPPVVFALATLLTLPCAVASWYLVERPFLRLKPPARDVGVAAGERQPSTIAKHASV
jgi:peptidoglycan/LPS O-acetylase OafA/YrhL